MKSRNQQKGKKKDFPQSSTLETCAIGLLQLKVGSFAGCNAPQTGTKFLISRFAHWYPLLLIKLMSGQISKCLKENSLFIISMFKSVILAFKTDNQLKGSSGSVHFTCIIIQGP